MLRKARRQPELAVTASLAVHQHPQPMLAELQQRTMKRVNQKHVLAVVRLPVVGDRGVHFLELKMYLIQNVIRNQVHGRVDKQTAI